MAAPSDAGSTDFIELLAKFLFGKTIHPKGQIDGDNFCG
jgi:hypothetical protein